jgi:hypothetical protein
VIEAEQTPELTMPNPYTAEEVRRNLVRKKLWKNIQFSQCPSPSEARPGGKKVLTC